MEILWVPREFSKDLLESGLLREKLPWWWDLLKRFELLQQWWIDYNRLIDNAMQYIPWLTKEDGMYIFAYTDLIFYERLNGFKRGIPAVLESMTPEQNQVATRFAQRLEVALWKMPNTKHVEWENIVVVYRWDGWQGWLKEVGELVELKWFTSVANNTDDIILRWENNIRITIEGQPWKVKDISSLAFFVNFADKINRPFTKNEWVILPNAKIEILHINTWKYFDYASKQLIDIVDIQARQER